MFPAPVAFAAARASRKLQLAPPPPAGQFDAVPTASSRFVATTYPGAVTKVPPEVLRKLFMGSEAVIVCEPGVSRVAKKLPVPAVRGLAAGGSFA